MTSDAAPALRLHVLDTGWCYASERVVMRGAPPWITRFHCLVALLHHPADGWTLFDTGYAPRLKEATARWPYRLYRHLAPFELPDELAVVNQLGTVGIAPGDVRRVVLSHFHADHLGGLRDFPGAEIVTMADAWESVEGATGIAALRRAFLPELIPEDFAARATLLPPPAGPPLPGLGPTHDLLGDGSMRLVRLPGHARGQAGMLARTDGGPVLLAADGAWMTQAVRDRRPPSRVAKLVVDDFSETVRTLHGLHAFWRAFPEVRIVPTHCPEAYAREVAG